MRPGRTRASLRAAFAFDKFTQKNLSDERTSFPPAPHDCKTCPQINIELWRKHQNTPLLDAHAASANSRRNLAKNSFLRAGILALRATPPTLPAPPHRAMTWQKDKKTRKKLKILTLNLLFAGKFTLPALRQNLSETNRHSVRLDFCSVRHKAAALNLTLILRLNDDRNKFFEIRLATYATQKQDLIKQTRGRVLANLRSAY